MTYNEINSRNAEIFGANLDSFEHIRALGERGVWMVMHPYTGEHMDVVDFDIEIAARHAAGFEGLNFWSAPLPEVEN